MKAKKNRIVLLIVVSFILIGGSSIVAGVLLSFHYNKLIVEYKNKTYQSTYVNDYQFSNIDYSRMEERLNEIVSKTLEKEIHFLVVNKNIIFKIKDFEPFFNTTEIINKIKLDAQNASYSDKIKLVKGEILHKYQLNIEFSKEGIDKVLKELSSKVDCTVKEERLLVNEAHVVSFDAGHDGYKMNLEKTWENLMTFLNNKKASLVLDNHEDYTVEVVGVTTPKKSTNLSFVNKKVSTFSTDFNNAGNRGYNISLAVSKINGTLLNPQDVFSFRQIAGPYTCDNGYRTAPVQSSSGYGCGGGVCQVSTTLYNAQLLAGLETVMRYNHGYAVNYVPRGQDATVGGDWVDYKFKNQYEYPVYIVSYIENSKVVMDIWTNEKALGNKKFMVTSNRIASGGYETYLHIYEGEVLVEKRLLHTSYYLG